MPPLGDLLHNLPDFLTCVAVEPIRILPQSFGPDFQCADCFAWNISDLRALQPTAAGVGVFVIPILRQPPLQILGHNADLRIFLLIELLHLTSHSLQIPGQVQLFALVVQLHRFAPDEAHHLRSQLGPHISPGLHRGVHHPKAAVACGVSQELGLVCGADKNALPGEVLRPSTIGGTEAVALLADVLLHALSLCLLHARQLTDLHDPDTIELLIGLFALHGAECVGEPGASKLCDECGLTQALPTSESQHIVELTTGVVDPSHRCDQGLAGYCSGVGAILSTEVVNQNGLQPGHIVPGASVQIIPDRVELVCHCHHVDSIENLIFPRQAINPFKVVAQIRIIGVSPGSVNIPPPREGVQDHDAVIHLIVTDAPCQGGISVENNNHVFDGGGDGPLFRDF